MQKFIEQINAANKLQLREMCKGARITGYSKMDNAGMRNALEASASTVPDFAVHGLHHCPHCEVHLGNGVTHYADLLDTNPKAAGKMVLEYICLGCNAEFGEKLQCTPAKVAKGGTGIKIQKDRPERNGIKRPSAGGKCALVWDMLDALQASDTSTPITLKQAKAQGVVHKYNINNVAIEFYIWRKYNA